MEILLIFLILQQQLISRSDGTNDKSANIVKSADMIKSAYLEEMINFYDQIFIIWRQLGGHFGLLDGANGDRSLADLINIS